MKLIFPILLLLTSLRDNVSVDGTEIILIGVMYPQTTNDEDFHCFYAAISAAVDRINKDDSILKNYEIAIHATKLPHPGWAVRDFYNMINHENETFVHALIGPAYSRNVEAIGYAATKHHMPIISYSALDEFGREEGEPKLYPYVLRTTPVLRYFVAAKEKVLRQFKWKRVSIIYDYESVLSILTVTDLTKLLTKAGVNVTLERPIFAERDSTKHLFNELEAYKRNMFGRKYQWIMGHGIPSSSFNVNDYHLYGCTKEEVLTAADKYITFDRSNIWPSDEITSSGLTPNEGYKLIKDTKLKQTKIPICNPISTFAFDAMYVVAAGLNNTLPSDGLKKNNITPEYTRERAQKLTKAMLQSDITGLSGPIRFDNRTEERLSDIVITQFKLRVIRFGNHTIHATTKVPVGIYSMLWDNITFFNGDETSIFLDNTVPKDGITVVIIAESYGLLLTAILWSMAFLGILLAFFFFFVNIRYRDEKLIKMSSPNINNGIITGCIVCYATVIVYGLDSQFLNLDKIKYACNAIILLLSIGFTLSFGCLFSKTWRIYRIFTAVKSMHSVNIQDHHLYGTILVLVIVDVALFVVWMTISPFKLIIQHSSNKLLEDIQEQHAYYKCECEYQLHFTILLFGYKGLLLLFGLFLAWETRHVKVAVLNDSKLIGMAIYNVAVTATIGAIGAIALYQTSSYETGFILVTIAIFLCTTVTLMLIFAPKVRILYFSSNYARNRATSFIVLHSTKLNMKRTSSNSSVTNLPEDSFCSHSKSSSVYNPHRPSMSM